MDDLIEALTIFRKYGNPSHPTNCTHDELAVAISPARLKALGFQPSPDGEGFYSYRFGSC